MGCDKKIIAHKLDNNSVLVYAHCNTLSMGTLSPKSNVSIYL